MTGGKRNEIAQKDTEDIINGAYNHQRRPQENMNKKIVYTQTQKSS